MRITGRDYTHEDLIAPWDPARRQRRPNSLRDDPARDDDRDELDTLGLEKAEPPEAKP